MQIKDNESVCICRVEMKFFLLDFSANKKVPIQNFRTNSTTRSPVIRLSVFSADYITN